MTLLEDSVSLQVIPFFFSVYATSAVTPVVCHSYASSAVTPLCPAAQMGHVIQAYITSARRPKCIVSFGLSETKRNAFYLIKHLAETGFI